MVLAFSKRKTEEYCLESESKNMSGLFIGPNYFLGGTEFLTASMNISICIEILGPTLQIVQCS